MVSVGYSQSASHYCEPSRSDRSKAISKAAGLKEQFAQLNHYHANMTIYVVDDASEFKYDNVTTDPDNLIFLIIYDHHKASKIALEWVENLSQDNDFASVRFIKNDAAKEEIADEFGVKHFPTCLLMKGGQVVGKIPTPRDENVIREALVKNSATVGKNFA